MLAIHKVIVIPASSKYQLENEQRVDNLIQILLE